VPDKKMPHPIKRFMTGMCYVALTVLVACAGTNPAFDDAEGKLKVTTTTGMIADAAKQVGGEHVQVEGLMKSGVDPHLFKASHGDIAKLEQADIIFYNGLHLEGKMVDMFEKMAGQKPTVAVARDIPETKLRGWEGGEGQHDPHIWFDVRHWMSATETIAAELGKLDPAHADSYLANKDVYLKQLAELHDYAGRQIASIPEQGRVLVTAHDAFGYFGDAYGIKVMGLQGISTAAEAGTKDVGDLRDYLVANKVKAVFVESSVPKKTIQAVIEGAKKKGHEVRIGGELFSDAMGKEGTAEGTYIGMVRHNVDTIVGALK